jgi:hypothetical protein
LSKQYLKIIKYFINPNADSINENYNFSICCLLIKKFCSKTINNELNDELNDYFKSLFNSLYKIHKKLIKKFSSSDMENNYLTESHIEFLKFYSINAHKLLQYGLEARTNKISQNLFSYILSLSEDFIKVNEDYYLKLKKTLVICVNSLSVEDFKEFLNLLDESVR